MKHTHNTGIAHEELEMIIKDQRVRREVTKECHYLFFHIYFATHVKYKTAEFQKNLFELTEDITKKNVVVESFRGSSKTTIMATSHVIWSILGVQQRKFILIIAKTESQARQYLANIKIELESNTLLRSDLGPFEEPDDEWRATSIVLPKYGARITVASVDSSIRGIKHGAHRPDLIICDDLEDLDIVKTQESRDKMFNWLMGDIIPLGDKGTRLIVIGTKLHNDSIIGRLCDSIAKGTMDGVTRRYPFLKEDGTAMWPEKFPTQNDIDIQKKSVPSIQAWEREYMLNIIANDDQVIRREWIQYYDSLPQDIPRYSATGIDPAISTNQEADYTAMVSGRIYGRKKSLKIYILPNPVNEHLDSKDIQDRAKELSKALGNGEPTTLWVESVGYQKSIIEHLVADGFPAKEYKPYGSDKRARLSVVATYIQSGTVVFPRHGAEALIEQMVNFGTEKHDDLSDAFCILVANVMDKESNIPKGHREFFNEKLLSKSYQSNIQEKEEKFLGVVMANRNRMKSAIVMRGKKSTEVLLHEQITDPVVLAQKVVDLALKYEVPLSYENIFVDITSNSQDLCKEIRKCTEGKYIIEKYEYHQRYGIDMNDSPQFEDELFFDNWARAYAKCAGWLEKDGRLVGQNTFDDLLYMTYTEQGGKRKMAERDGFIEDGIDTSIPDALAMTFAKEKRVVIRPTEEEIEDGDEMLHPEIGI